MILASRATGSEGRPHHQFATPAGRAACANRLPHSPALPVAGAIPDPAIPSRTRRSSFTNVKETKMTYELEIQIEELRRTQERF